MVGLIRQEVVADCAAACLAMIAGHHGRALSLAQARPLTHTGDKGATLYGIAAGAERLGLRAAGFTCSTGTLVHALADAELKLPIVVRIHEDSMLRFVVVLEVERGRVRIADPGRGLQKVTIIEFDRLWTGHLLSFSAPEELTGDVHAPTCGAVP